MTVSQQQPQEIKISEEYLSFVPRMPEKEYEALKEDIKEKGQDKPIVVNQDGIILDGYHRVRACQELELKPKYIVKTFEDRNDEALYVLTSALLRRHLDEGQRAVIALRMKPYLAAKGEQNMKAGKTLSPKGEKVNTEKQLAQIAGVGHNTINRTEQVQKLAQEQPDYNVEYKGKYATVSKLFQDVEAGTEPITAVHSAINKQQKITEKKEQAKKKAEELDLPEKIMLYNMDMTKVTEKQVADNSVDLIFTDPPYGLEYLYLFDDLADFANRKLKPGGSLVFFFGQANLPTILQYFYKYVDLRYWWMFAMKHEKPGGVIPQIKVIADWKPMLWFVKGKERLADGLVSDFIQSKAPDKDWHEWAQSEVEAEHIISNLTISEDSLVVDPFMGGGVFGITASKLGRYFKGIEVDKSKFDTAQDNIKDKVGIEKEDKA